MNTDLNCDMGEGFDADERIMPFISSANIACGAHAGDEDTMKKTIELALVHGVAIGAHPSYPDKQHFGRKDMKLSASDIYETVSSQLFKLTAIARQMGASVHHLKPHGALYNRAAADEATADAIVKALLDMNPNLILYGLSGSLSAVSASRAGIRFAHEVFADRTYTDEGMLTPRSSPYALIQDEASAMAQVMQMITSGTVTSTSGKTVSVKADTICIHGDGPHAMAFAQQIHQTLKTAGILINRFQ